MQQWNTDKYIGTKMAPSDQSMTSYRSSFGLRLYNTCVIWIIIQVEHPKELSYPLFSQLKCQYFSKGQRYITRSIPLLTPHREKQTAHTPFPFTSLALSKQAPVIGSGVLCVHMGTLSVHSPKADAPPLPHSPCHVRVSLSVSVFPIGSRLS